MRFPCKKSFSCRNALINVPFILHTSANSLTNRNRSKILRSVVWFSKSLSTSALVAGAPDFVLSKLGNFKVSNNRVANCEWLLGLNTTSLKSSIGLTNFFNLELALSQVSCCSRLLNSIT